MKLIRSMLYMIFTIINSASIVLGCPVCLDDEEFNQKVNEQNIPPHLTPHDVAHIYGHSYNEKK